MDAEERGDDCREHEQVGKKTGGGHECAKQAGGQPDEEIRERHCAWMLEFGHRWDSLKRRDWVAHAIMSAGVGGGVGGIEPPSIHAGAENRAHNVTNRLALM